MKPVPIHTAKTQLSRLIARACAGEDVVICKGTTPVVRLVRIDQAPPQRQFGAMRGYASTTPDFFEPLPDSELDAWEG